MSKLFVQGTAFDKAISNINDATFVQEIHDKFDENFKTMYRLPSQAWPDLLGGRSMVIVGRESSGKTLSYLPAILSSIVSDIEKDNEDSSDVEVGPVGIIIVNSCSEAEVIVKHINKLVSHDLRTVKITSKFNCAIKKIKANTCDLLITTPECFLRLVVRNNRLKYLVIDESLGMKKELLNNIIVTCTSGKNHPELNPQIIVTSTTWSEKLEAFMELSCNPIVVIGCLVEAAVYAKCHFQIVTDSFENKFDRLLHILQQPPWQLVKTLVVFDHQNELNYIAHRLKTCNIPFLAQDEEIDNMSKIGWETQESDEMTVLLATDLSISNSNLRKVQLLIHFSLPKKWSTFSDRFLVMVNRFQKSMEVNEETNEGKTTTVIMLDNKNVELLPQVIEFVEERKLVKVPKFDLIKVNIIPTFEFSNFEDF